MTRTDGNSSPHTDAQATNTQARRHRLIHIRAVSGSVAAERLATWLKGDYQPGDRRFKMAKRRMEARYACIALACAVDRETVESWSRGSVPHLLQRDQIAYIVGIPGDEWHVRSWERSAKKSQRAQPETPEPYWPSEEETVLMDILAEHPGASVAELRTEMRAQLSGCRDARTDALIARLRLHRLIWVETRPNNVRSHFLMRKRA
jgi:hypothetical protein